VSNTADRLFERVVRGVGWLAAIAALLVVGILDVSLNRALLPTVLLAIVVALVTPRLAAVPLGTGALYLGALVLLVTLTVPSVGYNVVPFGFTAAAVTVLVIGMTAWRAEPVRATFAVLLLLAGLVLQPLRLSDQRVSLILALALALGGVIAGAAGLSVRMLQTNRRRQMIAAQLAQRTGIASDLHDYVAHHVTGMVVLAQAARTVAASKPQAVVPALERIEAAGDEAMTAIRRMVTLLREPDAHARLSPPGTIADIASLAGHFTADDGPEVRLSIEGDFDDVTIDVQSAVHRVVMEALTNVRKHADAVRTLDIQVRRHDQSDAVTVEVSNDGRPRGGHPGEGGYGLEGLRERAAALGGSFTAGPRHPEGWSVQARIPAGGAR
jgi:signal transduction histidine kinase